MKRAAARLMIYEINNAQSRNFPLGVIGRLSPALSPFSHDYTRAIRFDNGI